jgi:MFS family permease
MNVFSLLKSNVFLVYARRIFFMKLGTSNDVHDFGAAQYPPKTLAHSNNSNLWYTFRSLSNRNYLWLWLGTLCMISGFQMQAIAQGYLVYEMTNSAKILGLVSTAGAVPVLILGLFAGAVADRIQRKFLVQISQAISAVIASIIALLIATETVTWIHLLVASLAQGAMLAFMAPARQALIPQLVERGKIGNAMALNAAVMGIAALVAPALAGLLYSFVGPSGVYVVVSIFGITALILTNQIDAGQRPSKKHSKVISDISAGIAYIWKNKPIKLHLAITIVTVILATPLISLLPVFVVDVFNKDSDALGLLVSMIGLGSLTGALIIAGIGTKNRGKIMMSGSLIAGISLILLGTSHWYAIAVPIMVLFGMGVSSNINLNQTLIIEIVDEKYRGRVMSFMMMAFSLIPFGVIPAGLAIDAVGIQLVVSLMGVTLLASTTIIYVSQKSIRNIQ